MRRKRYVVLALFAVWALCVSGCVMENRQSDDVRLYYAVSEEEPAGSAIGYETVGSESFQDIPGLMRLWLAGPVDSALQETVPQGTALRGYDFYEGQLHIDFTEEYGLLSGIRLAVANYCVTLTAAQLDGVEQVLITVAGRTLPGYNGASFAPEDAVLFGGVENPTLHDLQLYFPLTDESGLGTEYRVIEVSDETPATLADEILDQLEAGPIDQEMQGFLESRDSLAVDGISDGVCTLEMREEALRDLLGTNGVREIYLYAIVNSLAEVDGIEQVQFVHNGAAIEGLSDQPYTPDYHF